MKIVALNIQTVGIKSTSAIVSIGAVKFDPMDTTQEKETFYAVLDWRAQLNSEKFTFCSESRDYWETSPNKRVLNKKGAKMSPALTCLGDFIGGSLLVANGAKFTYGVLAHAYAQLGRETPWPHYKEHCARTFSLALEASRGGITRPVGDYVNPNAPRDNRGDALAMARSTAEGIQSVTRIIRKGVK